MTKDFVAEFLMLVDSTSDGIETSYNAAGVLAHMASDGAEGKRKTLNHDSIFCRKKNKLACFFQYMIELVSVNNYLKGKFAIFSHFVFCILF